MWIVYTHKNILNDENIKHKALFVDSIITTLHIVPLAKIIRIILIYCKRCLYYDNAVCIIYNDRACEMLTCTAVLWRIGERARH